MTEISSSFNTPVEVCDSTIRSGVMKSRLPLVKMLLLAFLAGAFIAFGAEASNMAAHTAGDVSIARLLAGVVFPAGLIMITLVSGELFTGNCLMVEALMSHAIGILGLLRNWIIVFLGNLVGALFIVGIVYLAGQLGYSDGGLGAYTIKVAYGKCSMTFSQALCSGILCNMLVCVAVLAATAARDVAGKVLGVFIPIFIFVLSGFEHSIANMYFIPAGMLAALNPTYAQKATEAFGITAQQMATLDLSGFLGNLLPVTLGNIIGGVIIGAVLYGAHKSRFCNPVDGQTV